VRVALLAVIACAAPARAEPDRAADLVARSVVLDEGQLAAELTVEANLAPTQVASPLSLAPDLWWGVTSRWTIGIVHSGPSVARFAPGASVCVRRDDFWCTRAYRGGGLDVRWRAHTGALEVAPRARVLVREVEPWKPALTAGALARWTRGRFAVVTDPYVRVGLANAEHGNRAALFLPVRLAVQPTCRWQVSLDTGWNSELAVIRDGWYVPVALGARARATAHLDIGATVGFEALLGPQNTPKRRTLFLAIGWRS
jgi:hypothetical protein